MSPNRKLANYKDKLDQATREAKATVLALLATIVVWVLLGFGLSGFDVWVFHMPLWAFAGTVGTWLFAVGVCVFLERRVFVQFDLDDIEEGQDAVRGMVRGAGMASQGASADVSTRGAGR